MTSEHQSDSFPLDELQEVAAERSGILKRQQAETPDAASDVAPAEETTPPPESEEQTPEQLAEAKEYHHKGLVCELLDRALDVAYLAAFTFLFAVPLDAWLAGYALFEPLWTRLIGLFAILTAGHLAISFPLSFYSGHVLEHRFGLSRQSLGRWLWRYAKRHGLTFLFSLLMVEGLYWIIWTTGAWWWLVAAGAFFAVSVILGQLAPVLILPLFYKYTRLEDEELMQRLNRLSEGTGLKVEGVYRLELSAETAKANAALAGMGSTRRVLLGDTLLDSFTPEEIEVVFAHEVGHHVHNHIRTMVAAGFIYSLGGFFVCHLLLAAWGRTVQGTLDYSTLPVSTLPLLMLAITIFSMLLEPLQNALSRHFERQADRYALDRTGHHDAFRSAFGKLAKLNKADPDPPRWEVILFHDHPPIAARLALVGGAK